MILRYIDNVASAKYVQKRDNKQHGDSNGLIKDKISRLD